MQDRVDQLESVVDLVSNFGTSEDNLAADEDQEHDLGLDHAVDETREQLGFVGTEVVVARSQTLQTDGELDVARANDVLDLEIRELGVEACCLLATWSLSPFTGHHPCQPRGRCYVGAALICSI